MKKRLGFVSNSSSSSFICDVCNEVESGMEMGLEEAGMYECEKGHIFCISHSLHNLEDLPDEIKFKLVADYAIDKYDDDKEKEIEVITKEKNDFIINHSKEELLDLFDEDKWDEDIMNGYYVPSALCPICQMTDFSDADLLKHLIKESGQGRKDIEDKIRNTFSAYDEFNKTL